MIELKKQNTTYLITFENDNYKASGSANIGEDNYTFNMSINDLGNKFIGNISYNTYNKNESYSFSCNRSYTINFSNIMNEVIEYIESL